MATENTPPKNSLILLFAFIAVATLLVLEPVFRSYFSYTVKATEQAAISSPSELLDMHEHERAELDREPSITTTMQSQVRDVRAHAAENHALGALSAARHDAKWASVSPAASSDTDPLIGWKERPTRILSKLQAFGQTTAATTEPAPTAEALPPQKTPKALPAAPAPTKPTPQTPAP